MMRLSFDWVHDCMINIYGFGTGSGRSYLTSKRGVRHCILSWECKVSSSPDQLFPYLKTMNGYTKCFELASSRYVYM